MGASGIAPAGASAASTGASAASTGASADAKKVKVSPETVHWRVRGKASRCGTCSFENGK